ncbi:MAG: hypothetical protein AAFR95_18430, partial [Bacteroidota bacterium]
QVLYVAHSMGGSMLRYAEQALPHRYYRKENYGHGFVDRAVTINTPHFGSPLADVVIFGVGALNAVGFIGEVLISNTYRRLTSLFGIGGASPFFNLVRPDEVIDAVTGARLFTPSPAVSDLRVLGGQRFAATNIPTLLIAGDVFPTISSVDIALPIAATNPKELGDIFVQGINLLYDWTLSMDGLDETPEGLVLKSDLIALAGLDGPEKALRYLDVMVKFEVGSPFFFDSDWVVSLESQMAGLQEQDEQVRVMKGAQFRHTGVTDNEEIGNVIGAAFDEDSSEWSFDPIPASPATRSPAPDQRLGPVLARHASRSSMVDRLKASATPTVSISSEQSTVAVDSLLAFDVTVSDTTGLFLTKVYFQSAVVSSQVQETEQRFEMQAGADLLGYRVAEVRAFFDTAEGIVTVTDTISVAVETSEIPTQLFADVEQFNLAIQSTMAPTFTAVYPTFLRTVVPGSEGLSLTVEDGSVLRYDAENGQFEGLSNGGTRVFAALGSLSDTLYVSVGSDGEQDDVVFVDVTVWLEGPYDEGSSTMRVPESSETVVPGTQPFIDAAYDSTPLAYDGIESAAPLLSTASASIVEWVLVELRATPNGAAVAQQAAVLRSDGKIRSPDGFSSLSFSSLPGTDYYVVVRSRNHLPVMSAGALDFSGDLVTYDFTTSLAQAYTMGGVAMKALGEGGTAPFALWSGDADLDGSVLASDYQVEWRTQVGLEGYLAADFDLDGSVLAADYQTFWRANVGLAESQVPEVGGALRHPILSPEARYALREAILEAVRETPDAPSMRPPTRPQDPRSVDN